ncbi:MAG: hypothetical protein WCX80_03675, partial [Patescibacteria group bacterium]
SIETKDAVLEKVIEESKNRDPLAILTNASIFNITPLEQGGLLQNIAQDDSGLSFKQLLDHPEKYPDLSPEMVESSFTSFLDRHSNRDTLSKIIYSKIPINSEQKKKLIDQSFAGCNYPLDLLVFLSRNRQYLDSEDRLLIETKFLEVFSKNPDINNEYDLSVLTPENMESAIAKVRSIEPNCFVKWFIDDNNLKLDKKYFDYLLGKVSNPEIFLNILSDYLIVGKISADKYQEIFIKVFNFASVDSLLRVSTIYKTPESNEILWKRLEKNNNNGEAFNKILNLVESGQIEVPEEKKIQLYQNAARTIDISKLSSFIGNRSSGFGRWAELNNMDDVANLCIREKNNLVPVSILKNFSSEISLETFHKLVDFIINSDEISNKIDFLESIHDINYRNKTSEDRGTVSQEELASLTEKMIASGSNQELLSLLKGFDFNDNNLLSPDKEAWAKEKILESSNFEDIVQLLNSNSLGEISLVLAEKHKIG